MSILSKLMRRQAVEKSDTLEDRWVRERFADGDEGATGGTARTPALTKENFDSRGYAGHSWTYVCINRIVTMGSNAPWAMVREDEEQPKHPLTLLLNAPNPVQNDVRLLTVCLLSLELWGNAYLVIERGAGNKPVELWPIPGNRMAPARMDKGVPAAYELTADNGRKVIYPREDVVWLHYEGPGSALDSVPASAPALAAISTDIYALRANLAYFERGANPKWALTTNGPLNNEQRRSLRESFAALYQGIGKWFRPLVLEGGMGLQQLDDKPDGSWLELRTQLRQEILSVYGVPPAIAGIFDNAQFGVSLREQRAMMWENCLLPRLGAVAADIQQQLALQFGEDGSEFTWLRNQIPALQPNWTEQVAAAVAATGGPVMTVNEARERMLDLEPLADAWGETRWGPFSTVPLVTATGDMMSSGPAPTPAPAEDAAPKTVTVTARRKEMRRLSVEARTALWKAFNANRDSETKQIKRVVAAWYETVTYEMLGNFGAGKGDLGSRVKAPNIDVLVFDRRGGTAALREMIEPVLQSILKAAGQEAIASLGADLRFDVQSPQALALLADRVQEMKTVVATAQDAVRASLAEGIANGETVDQLTDRVMQWSASGKLHHAENVARTESGIVMNTAALQGYKQGGATGKEWLSIVDDRSRQHHADMDGVVVGIDASFDLDGVECDGPGDPALGPEDVCNCRCTVAPVIEV